MRVNVLKKRTIESSSESRQTQPASGSRVKAAVRLSPQDLSTAMADALEDILRAERRSRLSH